MLQKTLFDDAEICTLRFGDLLRKLMEYSADQAAHFVVLDPDPVYYFYPRYHKYSALEISFDDAPNAYLAALNENPGDNPAAAIGTNWWALVIVPPSLKWFVHVLRSDSQDSGHLWVPKDWVARVRNIYPYVHAARHAEPEQRREFL
jgi:hypothetical protein